MANKCMKRYSTSLIIRKLQTKTTVSSYLTSFRAATKTERERERQRERVELSYDLAIVLMVIYPKELKAGFKEMFVHLCLE